MRYEKLKAELHRFMACHEEMQAIMSSLTGVAKEEGMELITDHMKAERPEDAKKAIDDIEQVVNLAYRSNATDIEELIKGVFGIGENLSTYLGKGFSYEQMEPEVIMDIMERKGFHYIQEKEGHTEYKCEDDFYYVIQSYEKLSEEEVKKILDTKYRYRNLGFLCANQQMKEMVEGTVDRWVNENDKKFIYLTIHFATFEDLIEKQPFFETKDYTKKKAVR